MRTDSRKIVNVAVRQLGTGTRTFLPWAPWLSKAFSKRKRAWGLCGKDIPTPFFRSLLRSVFLPTGLKSLHTAFTGGRGRSPVPGRDTLIPCHKSSLPSSFPYMLPERGDTHQPAPLSKNPLSALAPCKRQQKIGQPVTANRLFLLWCARRDSNSWPTGS